MQRFDSDIAASIDAIRGASVEQIELSVDRLFGDCPTAAWQSVLRNPSRWADGFGRAIESAWEAIDPLWTEVVHILDREIERAGIAAVRGQATTLLGGLNGRIRLAEDCISYHHPTPLEDAGLIWRQKRGRSVRAVRSPRGDRLLTIMQ